MPCCVHGGRDQHDERAGRSADLKPAAAQQRDEEAADDRGVEPALGVAPEAMAIAIDRGSATMATVRPATASAEVAEAVALAQDRDELWREQFARRSACSCGVPSVLTNPSCFIHLSAARSSVACRRSQSRLFVVAVAVPG